MSKSFKRFDIKVKQFKVTIQSCTGEPLTQHQIGEVILDLEQKINSMVLDSRDKNVLASARVHIEVPERLLLGHPIMRWPNRQPLFTKHE